MLHCKWGSWEQSWKMLKRSIELRGTAESRNNPLERFTPFRLSELFCMTPPLHHGKRSLVIMRTISSQWRQKHEWHEKEHPNLVVLSALIWTFLKWSNLQTLQLHWKYVLSVGFWQLGNCCRVCLSLTDHRWYTCCNHWQSGLKCSATGLHFL